MGVVVFTVKQSSLQMKIYLTLCEIFTDEVIKF